MYKIKRISSMVDIEQGELAEVNVYNWGGEYRPLVYAKLCYVENEGFGLKLYCEEKNPLARHTPDEKNAMVCKDSCLEMFADFKPTLQKGYINFEANANGSLLCEFGKDNQDRKFLVDMGLKHPTVTPFKTETEWGYTLFVPFSLIKQLYGNAEFCKGDMLRVGFFKCGDETEQPHYASFTEIKWEYPSFHRPQFFADMIID